MRVPAGAPGRLWRARQREKLDSTSVPSSGYGQRAGPVFLPRFPAVRASENREKNSLAFLHETAGRRFAVPFCSRTPSSKIYPPSPSKKSYLRALCLNKTTYCASVSSDKQGERIHPLFISHQREAMNLCRCCRVVDYVTAQ